MTYLKDALKNSCYDIIDKICEVKDPESHLHKAIQNSDLYKELLNLTSHIYSQPAELSVVEGLLVKIFRNFPMLQLDFATLIKRSLSKVLQEMRELNQPSFTPNQVNALHFLLGRLLVQVRYPGRQAGRFNICLARQSAEQKVGVGRAAQTLEETLEPVFEDLLLRHILPLFGLKNFEQIQEAFQHSFICLTQSGPMSPTLDKAVERLLDQHCVWQDDPHTTGVIGEKGTYQARLRFLLTLFNYGRLPKNHLNRLFKVVFKLLGRLDAETDELLLEVFEEPAFLDMFNNPKAADRLPPWMGYGNVLLTIDRCLINWASKRRQQARRRLKHESFHGEETVLRIMATWRPSVDNLRRLSEKAQADDTFAEQEIAKRIRKVLEKWRVFEEATDLKNVPVPSRFDYSNLASCTRSNPSDGAKSAQTLIQDELELVRRMAKNKTSAWSLHLETEFRNILNETLPIAEPLELSSSTERLLRRAHTDVEIGKKVRRASAIRKMSKKSESARTIEPGLHLDLEKCKEPNAIDDQLLKDSPSSQNASTILSNNEENGAEDGATPTTPTGKGSRRHINTSRESSKKATAPSTVGGAKTSRGTSLHKKQPSSGSSKPSKRAKNPRPSSRHQATFHAITEESLKSESSKDELKAQANADLKGTASDTTDEETQLEKKDSVIPPLELKGAVKFMEREPGVSTPKPVEAIPETPSPKKSDSAKKRQESQRKAVSGREKTSGAGTPKKQDSGGKRSRGSRSSGPTSPKTIDAAQGKNSKESLR